MDGSTITALLVGVGAVVSSAGGIAVQLRRSDPENVRLLQQRVEAAEQRAAAAEERAATAAAATTRLREAHLATEAGMFALQQVVLRHGLMTLDELHGLLSRHAAEQRQGTP